MVVNIVDVGWATSKSGCLPITGDSILVVALSLYYEKSLFFNFKKRRYFLQNIFQTCISMRREIILQLPRLIMRQAINESTNHHTFRLLLLWANLIFNENPLPLHTHKGLKLVYLLHSCTRSGTVSVRLSLCTVYA